MRLFSDLQSSSVDDYEGGLDEAEVPPLDSHDVPLPTSLQWQQALERIQASPVTLLHAKARVSIAITLPQLLLKLLPSARGKEHTPSICVLQPKRISCVQSARSTAAQLKADLGSSVRFCIAKAEGPSPKGVTFATYRWFLEYTSRKNHEAFDYIIVDHAHDTSIELECVMTRLLDILASSTSARPQMGLRRRRRPQGGIHLVISSHSLPTEQFAQKFEQYLTSKDAVTVEDDAEERGPTSSGGQSSVDTVYLNQLLDWAKSHIPDCVDDDLEQSIINETNLQQAQYVNDREARLHDNPPSFRDDLADTIARIAIAAVHAKGNTVLFVPALCDIEMMEEKVIQLVRLPGSNVKVNVAVLHAMMPIAAQVDVLAEDTTGRTLFLVTDIAEAVAHVPSVSCVIDTGMALIRRRFTAADVLLQMTVHWISQAAAEDRSRVAASSATVLRTYTEDLHCALPPHDFPESENMPAHTQLLWKMLFGVVPPSWRSHRHEAQQLLEADAIAADSQLQEEASLTALGMLSLSLPIDSALTGLLVHGIATGVLEEAIVMAAFLSVPDPFYNLTRRGLGNLQRYNDVCFHIAVGKQRFGGEHGSELVGSLLMYVTCFLRVRPDRRMATCWEHGLALKRLQLMDSVVRQLCDRLAPMFPEVALEGEEKILSTAFVAKLEETCANLEQSSSVLQTLRCVIFGSAHRKMLSGRCRVETSTIATAQTHLTLIDSSQALANETPADVWQALQSILKIDGTEASFNRLDAATFEFVAHAGRPSPQIQPATKINDFAPMAKRLVVFGGRRGTVLLNGADFLTTNDEEAVALKVKQQVRWRWMAKLDRVLVPSFMDASSVWRSEMFGVANELGPTQESSTFRGLSSKGFTYLPYPTLTVAILAIIFDVQIQECVAFWADAPATGYQLFPGQACAGIAVNTEAVGVIVGATCLPSSLLLSLLASVAELRTRFMANQLLESIASRQRHDTIASHHTHHLLQDVLLLSSAVDCIARFYNVSLAVNAQSECSFRTEIIGKEDETATEKRVSFVEMHAQHPCTADYLPALPMLTRQQFDFDEATHVHRALRSRIYDQLSRGLSVHPIATPVLQILANVLAQLPSTVMPAVPTAPAVAVSRKKREWSSTDVQSARGRMLALANLATRTKLHSLQTAYHRLHNEELEDYLVMDILTNAGYRVAPAAERQAITAGDQVERDVLRNKLADAISELRQPENPQSFEIPDCLQDAVSQLAQEFTTNPSVQSLTSVFYFLHGVELPGRIASRILDAAGLLVNSKRARIADSDEQSSDENDEQAGDTNIDAGYLEFKLDSTAGSAKAAVKPMIALFPSQAVPATTITPEELERRILSVVYTLPGPRSIGELNEKYQKLFKPNCQAEQVNKKIAMQTLTKAGIPLTQTGFIGGRPSERQQYVQDSNMVIVENKGFEQNVLNLAAEMPGGEVSALIETYKLRFRPSSEHVPVSKKSVRAILEQNGFLVDGGRYS